MDHEKHITFDNNGCCLKLPVGYRFDPSDEVLLNYYLKKKFLSEPLPFDVIPEFDVFQTQPWCLPGVEKNSKEVRYFCFNLKNRLFEDVNKRVAGNGEWRVGEIKEIEVTKIRGVFGKKKTLNFWLEKGAVKRKTRWVMHEFRFASISNPSNVSNWAVYRIFQKKKVAKKATTMKGKRVHKKANFKKTKVEIKSIHVDFSDEESSCVSGTNSPPISP